MSENGITKNLKIYNSNNLWKGEEFGNLEKHKCTFNAPEANKGDSHTLDYSWIFV